MDHNLPVLREGTYQNPVIFQDQKTHTNPDPYLLEFGGKYYCYSSDAGGVKLSVSKDLVHWKYHGYALSDREHHDYWAPCVLYKNGLFYLYYSSTLLTETDCHQEFLKLAVADNPYGPFVYKKTFFEKFSIDAHVVQVEHDVYLYYSTNDIAGTDPEKAGTCILVDRLVKMDELEGKPRAIILPSIGEEIYQKNRFGDGRDWYTIEGAFYLERHQKSYCMYSANAHVNTNYYIGYSVGDYKKNPREICWNKYPSNHTFQPLIQRNECVEGTGHNSVVKAPNLMDDWIIYHGRNAEESIIQGVEQRVMRIDPLFFDGDRMVSNAPSNEIQTCPLLAKEEREKFTLQAQELWFSKECYSYYVARIYLETKKQHTGERYGIYVAYHNEQNYMEVEFCSGNNQVTIINMSKGIKKVHSKYKLESDYNHQVVHKIWVERKYNQIMLQIDDGKKWFSSCDVGHAKIGVATHFTDLSVCHLAITQGMDLWGEELAVLGEEFDISSSSALQENGISIQKSTTLYKNICERGSFQEEFTFELWNEHSKLEYVMYDKSNYRICIQVNNMQATICYMDEVQSIPIEDATFSFRLFFEKDVVWFIINGKNTKDYFMGTEISEEKWILQNLTIQGYQWINHK